ncbi:MAG TPA: CDP-6-deoxy-delta-3,4-glucoseen reductase [Thiobacillaceae bacterium]|nr:CDP-6-deoxy-delta-3,4-glucoseen reductase [Thiobacillaceae bacterium]
MSFKVTIQPSGRTFTAAEGKSILASADDAGIKLPHACQNGACGACEGRILAGTVDYGEYQESLLTEFDKEEGLALFCAARPLSDLTIEAWEIESETIHDPVTVNARVARMERLCHDVMGVWLSLPEGAAFSFLAGQYVDFLLEDGRRRSFSMANSADGSGQLEFHIRHVPGGYFTERVFNTLKVGDEIGVHGPLGTFFLRDTNRPVLFIAGGTGYAPVKSMVEKALAGGELKRPMRLYWGARQSRDLYLAGQPEAWARADSNFSFVPVLSEPDGSGWTGRSGLVHEAALADLANLADWDVYVCGAPAMVEAARRDFLARGLPREAFHSDAYTYQSTPAQP